MIPCLSTSSNSESLCILFFKVFRVYLFATIFSLWHDASDLLSPSWLILKWTWTFPLFCPQINVSMKLINKIIHRSIRLKSYRDYLDDIIGVTETKDSTSKLIWFNPLSKWMVQLCHIKIFCKRLTSKEAGDNFGWLRLFRMLILVLNCIHISKLSLMNALTCINFTL